MDQLKEAARLALDALKSLSVEAADAAHFMEGCTGMQCNEEGAIDSQRVDLEISVTNGRSAIAALTAAMALHDAPFGMSMFATRKDYKDAVVTDEEYDPEDAFNDGEDARYSGLGQNPYSPNSQPNCFAAWNRRFNGTKPAAVLPDAKPLTARVMKIGGRYNWKNQPERLIYLGGVRAGGWWHQFAKVEAPTTVWCEVTDDDLRMLEKTIEPQPVIAPEPVAAESRFIATDQEWARCSIEHARMVFATPNAWAGYEARYLYAAPQPAIAPAPTKPIEWVYGPSVWKDWCAQWFGSDADDDYLAKAIFALPAMAQKFSLPAIAPEPVGLTEEETTDVIQSNWGYGQDNFVAVVHAVEAASHAKQRSHP